MSGVLAVVAALQGSPVTLSDATVLAIGASNQTASFTLRNDGVALELGSSTETYDWIASWGVPADYEVRATATSGTPDSGTTDAWLALDTSRTWTISDTVGVAQEVDLTIEVRRASGAVLATASITLHAEKSI